MKIEKCQCGYIKKKKKVDFIWLLACVVVAIGIFLTGYLWTKTRANVFTVLAVLMVLPAAKRVVALVVMVPRKSVEKERYERVKEAAGACTILADYVFTSTDKIMHLDLVIIKNGNVLGLVAPSKQDVEYMKKYLADSVRKSDASFHVKVVDSEEKLLKELGRLTQIQVSPEKEEKVVTYLRTLAV